MLLKMQLQLVRNGFCVCLCVCVCEWVQEHTCIYADRVECLSVWAKQSLGTKKANTRWNVVKVAIGQARALTGGNFDIKILF